LLNFGSKIEFLFRKVKLMLKTIFKVRK